MHPLLGCAAHMAAKDGHILARKKCRVTRQSERRQRFLRRFRMVLVCGFLCVCLCVSVLLHAAYIGSRSIDTRTLRVQRRTHVTYKYIVHILNFML